jgi:hypothetical protein
MPFNRYIRLLKKLFFCKIIKHNISIFKSKNNYFNNKIAFLTIKNA